MKESGIIEPLVAALVELHEKQPYSHVPMELFSRLNTELEAATQGGKPAPPWAQTAADLVLKIAPYQYSPQTSFADSAMDFYVKAAQATPEAVEAMVLDEMQEPGVRAAALAKVIELKPATAILPGLTKTYDRLPYDLRKSLGPAAAAAPKAEGAAALLARFLRDTSLCQELETETALRYLSVPLRPELRAAIGGLRDDPGLGPAAREALRRAEKGKQQ